MVPKGWKEVYLKDITTVIQNGFSCKQDNLVNGMPVTRIETISDGYVNFNRIGYTNVHENILEPYLLQHGDILFSHINSVRQIGKVAIFESQKLLYHGMNLLLIQIKNNIALPKYVYYVLSSRHAKSYFKKHSKQAVNQASLNQKDVGMFKLLLPSLKEQNKITSILSTWDKAIEKTTTLINSKAELKKALMQQLLTGKLRFKEFVKIKFYKIELGKFLIPTPRSVPRPNAAYTALGIRSHGKGTFLKAVENPETVMMDTIYEVKKDDLIVNITFAWEGAIAIVRKSDEGALVSHRFPTYTFNREIAISEYFRHVIQTKRFVYELGLVSPGGAGRNRVMSKTDFLNIFVSIPSIAEQQKIAAVLNGIDKEIDLLKKQLECLKTQKKGMMQKLLTGEIRVKTVSEVR
jgi:type I restriction enzyme S subunit